MCQIWTNTVATGRLCILDLEQHRSLQQDCLRVISFGRFQMWSNTAAATRLGTGQQMDRLYCCIQKLSLIGRREIIRRTGESIFRDDQIDENCEKNLMAKSEKCV